MLNGAEFNEKSDIWSAGILIHILLCGYPPFSGKTLLEIETNIKIGDFTFASIYKLYLSLIFQ